MRILIYGLNFYPELTGIGKYTGEMVEWLKSRAHDVRVVTAPPYYPAWQVAEGYCATQYKIERWGDVQVWRTPLWVPNRPNGIKRLIHLASFALSSLPVLFSLLSWKPNVVLTVAPTLFCAANALLAARFCGAKSWLHVQDFETDAAFEMGFFRFRFINSFAIGIERLLLKRFDMVSTISIGMRKRLKLKGVTLPRRTLLPNWVDTDAIYPNNKANSFRDELGIGDKEIVALYSGNMGQKQGLEIIIDAARILQLEKNVRFVMCGSGSFYSRMRKYSESLKNIIWLPLQPLERLNDLLNLADIHLLPQKDSAADLVMPSKLTGMLASGKPVIATASHGTELWSVVEGRGINTPPGDAGVFADAIRSLAYDPDRRAALGRNGRRYAVENLGRDAVLKRFESELINLVAEK